MPTPPDDADPKAKRNWGPRLALIGVFAITLFSIFGGVLLAPDADDSRAPRLGLTDLEGTAVEVNADDLPTVVLFSEVSCSTCPADLRAIEAASRRWRGKVTFVTIAPEAEAEVAVTVERLELTHPVASDPEGAVAQRYRVEPEKASTFVFVAATGRILDRERGPIGADTLERRIRGLISAGPKPT